MRKDKIIDLITLPNVMVTKQEAAQRLGLAPRTIQGYMADIEQMKDRYGDKVVTRNWSCSLVNILALYDYLHYRDMLNEKNVKKNVPPYNPGEWIRTMGWDVMMEDCNNG